MTQPLLAGGCKVGAEVKRLAHTVQGVEGPARTCSLDQAISQICWEYEKLLDVLLHDLDEESQLGLCDITGYVSSDDVWQNLRNVGSC